MINVVYGHVDSLEFSNTLREIMIQALPDDIRGTLYFGYPIFVKFDEDQDLYIEGLLITEKHGVIGLTRYGLPLSNIEDAQNKIYSHFHSKLITQNNLRNKKNLKISLNIITYTPHETSSCNDNEYFYFQNAQELKSYLDSIEADNKEQNIDCFPYVNAVIESVVTLRVKKKRAATKKDSIGNVFDKIESSIANLDIYQKQAALEISNGPQRIRGLAGSGKTIVLALKAAYLHLKRPNKKICITFNTRSLKGEFEKLLTRFVMEQINDEPDWSLIEIIHAWGANSFNGVYSKIAQAYNKPIYNLDQAKFKFGYDKAFHGACNELLESIKDEEDLQLFDTILIDEAQDLPRSFFELVYKVCGQDKHIIWAYDELQTISKLTMPSPEILFGSHQNGEPRVRLINSSNQAKQDIVLKTCYRTPPWIISLAHSLGFGLKMQKGPIQAFESPHFWEDIGYICTTGELNLGEEITLERDPKYIPSFFSSLIKKESSVTFKTFENKDAQYKKVVEDIKCLIEEEEVLATDILVINANPLTTKKEMLPLRRLLSEENIDSHIAGVTSSVDNFFIDDCVTLSGIYRAKGNEAAIVIIVNSEYCFEGTNDSIIIKRNILFTAMTRSKGYLKIYGCGEDMDELGKEIELIRNDNYNLIFKYPTDKELTQIKTIYQSNENKKTTTQAQAILSKVADQIKEGSLDVQILKKMLTPEQLDLIKQLYNIDE